MSQRIEQGRFTRIRVSNQGHVQYVTTGSRLALYATLAFELVQALLQQLDPLAKQTSVGLELRFAWSAQTDTTLLPLQVRPSSNQARREMIKLRELDLQFPVGGLRALGKNVENQTCSIDDPTLKSTLEVSLLSG